MCPAGDLEKMDMSETSTLAVVVARLDDLRDSQKEYEDRLMKEMQNLRSELRETHADHVSRGEWMQRNAYVDGFKDALSKEISEVKDNLGKELQNIKTDLTKDISEVKQEQASKRVPMTAWIAVVVAALTFGWTILGPAIVGASNSEPDTDVPTEQV